MQVYFNEEESLVIQAGSYLDNVALRRWYDIYEVVTTTEPVGNKALLIEFYPSKECGYISVWPEGAASPVSVTRELLEDSAFDLKRYLLEQRMKPIPVPSAK